MGAGSGRRVGALLTAAAVTVGLACGSSHVPANDPGSPPDDGSSPGSGAPGTPGVPGTSDGGTPDGGTGGGATDGGTGGGATDGGTGGSGGGTALPECPTVDVPAHEADADVNPPPGWNANWSPLGGAMTGQNPYRVQSVMSSLAVDSASHPVVAWVQTGQGVKGEGASLYVRRWSGSGWQSVGRGLKAVAGESNPPASPSLVLDRAGNPVVAWSEGDGVGSSHLFVCRWDGNTWRSLGGALSARSGTTVARLPSLRFWGDAPVIAWSEAGASDVAASVYVRRWDGNAWQAVGDGLNTQPEDTRGKDNSAARPWLAADGAGNLVVAFDELNPETHVLNISVYRWGQGAWTPVGGPLHADVTEPSGPTSAMDATLTLDGGGTPIVAWGQGMQDYVARWTGSQWEFLGAPLAVGAVKWIGSPMVAADLQGRPVVADLFEDESSTITVRVRRWEGAGWSLLGGNLNVYPGATSVGSRPGLALDRDGVPFVSFSEGSTPPLHNGMTPLDLFVWRYAQPH